MNVTTSNCSNNYGPYHFPEKLIPLIIINLLHGKNLPAYGDGKNIRDWLYVEDHARGIEMVLKEGRIGETYNIGGVNELTNIDIVTLIIDIVTLICQLMSERFVQNPLLSEQYAGCPAASGTNCETLITYVTNRAGHDFRYAIDTTRIKNESG